MVLGLRQERMDMEGYEHKEDQVGEEDSLLAVRLEFPVASGEEENDSQTPGDEGIVGA